MQYVRTLIVGHMEVPRFAARGTSDIPDPYCPFRLEGRTFRCFVCEVSEPTPHTIVAVNLETERCPEFIRTVYHNGDVDEETYLSTVPDVCLLLQYNQDNR